ncbi:MAG: hypothetical protein Tsb0013_23090 [Phycisphaerales bacterium]
MRLPATLRTAARFAALALVLGAFVPATAPLAAVAQAAPQPKPVPTRWEFRVDAGPLRTMIVETDEFGPLPFYYFVYEVANTTDQDRVFAPAFDLATDLGVVYRSGEGVPADVPEKIILALKEPLMQSEIDIQGILPQGKENARQGVVVWPIRNTQIDEVTVYAAGFSGETVKVVRPDNGEEVVLRKTLMLRHAVPGELVVTSDKPLERTVDQWVMR